jgi:hypothetical protein
MSGLLYIAEVDELGVDANGNQVMAGLRPLLVPAYSIIIGTLALSPVFGGRTRFLELHNEDECWFDVAVNPNPVRTAEHLGAGERIFYPLRPGIFGLRIGVIGV